VAESFFATLKTELVNEADFVPRAQARTAIFDGSGSHGTQESSVI
jgi:hypothetical protein